MGRERRTRRDYWLVLWLVTTSSRHRKFGEFNYVFRTGGEFSLAHRVNAACTFDEFGLLV
jgi:hypothetical protein